MVASFALTNTAFLMNAELCRMTMYKGTRLTPRNVSAVSISIKEYVAPKKCYCISGQNIASSKEKSVTDYDLITLEEQCQQAVKSIKKLLMSKSREYCHVEELVMIDAIQRLGLECYFEDDIHAALRKHYERCSTMEGGDNLHETALRFRLLRQEGYKVSADTFSKFKGEDGRFRKEHSKDIKGLMSLFEASHLSIPSDHELDDVGEFSTHFLHNLKNVDASEAEIIEKTLKNPYHKSLPRLVTKNSLHQFGISLKYLHGYNDQNTWISKVQDLAIIDINMAHISHQDEINQVCRWWKKLRLSEELKLARNQPVKWHMWSLACLPGPTMTQQRLELTKPISFIYFIDDIFDVYGTLEELTIFTEAVNRWEFDDIKGLPNYMTICLKALDDTTNEMSQKIYNKHGWNPKNSIQKAWAELCNAFLTEAKWFASGHMPTPEEYLKNGILSTGLYIVYVYVFLLFGEKLDHNCTHLLETQPDIVSLAATIFRLWDDLGSAEDEKQNGQDGSYITYYMNEHNGCSNEKARGHVHTMILEAWKCLNETCLCPSFSTDLKAAFLNIARMVPLMYDYDDNHHLPILEKHMKSLFIAHDP